MWQRLNNLTGGGGGWAQPALDLASKKKTHSPKIFNIKPNKNGGVKKGT